MSDKPQRLVHAVMCESAADFEHEAAMKVHAAYVQGKVTPHGEGVASTDIVRALRLDREAALDALAVLAMYPAEFRRDNPDRLLPELSDTQPKDGWRERVGEADPMYLEGGDRSAPMPEPEPTSWEDIFADADTDLPTDDERLFCLVDDDLEVAANLQDQLEAYCEADQVILSDGPSPADNIPRSAFDYALAEFMGADVSPPHDLAETQPEGVNRLVRLAASTDWHWVRSSIVRGHGGPITSQASREDVNQYPEGVAGCELTLDETEQWENGYE